MVSSGDGPVGASKLTEEVGAKEGTFDNSVLVVYSWLRCLTVGRDDFYGMFRPTPI